MNKDSFKELKVGTYEPTRKKSPLDKHAWKQGRYNVTKVVFFADFHATTQTCFYVANDPTGCDKGGVSISHPIHRHVGHLSESQRVSEQETGSEASKQTTRCVCVWLPAPNQVLLTDAEIFGLSVSTGALQLTNWGNRIYKNIAESKGVSWSYAVAPCLLDAICLYHYLWSHWGVCVCLAS